MHTNQKPNQAPDDPTKGKVAKVIDWSIKNQILVLVGAVALLVAGYLSIHKIPLDAIPDLSDTQVIIRTDWAGQSPQIIEDQVTYPLTAQMLSLPKTKAVRGYSMFGTSFVYVVFEDNVDMYWARSRTLEYLSQASGNLPAGIEPKLGPDASGVGWVFQYALYDRTGKTDLAELRSLQDWYVRYELATVSGVSEVASVGGFVNEYQVLVDPNKLRAYQVTLNDVIQAVRQANQETGGRTLEMAETEYLIRSLGYIQTPSDLEKVHLKVVDGTPITLADVARVVKGPSIRRGITELNGEGEAVGGIVVMRPGNNALEVIEKIKSRITQIKQGLPEGVELKVVYDRSKLIEGSVNYLKNKLIEESLVVALVVFLFLMHIRSAFVAIITIPLGILAAFIVMQAQGITANIMSLGGIAIAIGAMVDASIVMVENAHRKLAALPNNSDKHMRRETLILAAKEVGPGLFFSLLIITVSFFPVFALNGQSAKLFTPLALTKTYAMAFSALLSITVIPVLMLWLIKGKVYAENKNPLNRLCLALYRPILSVSLKWRKTTLLMAVIALLSAAWPSMKIGSEFMPPLYEGDLLYMPMTLPGVSTTKAREILQVTNRQLMQIPEIEHVFGKAGRAETATDPAPLAMIETWVELKPREQWRPNLTPQKLIDELNQKVGLPGMINSWGYPIKIRLDMLTTGIRTPIGIKIAGDELQKISEIAKQVESLVKQLPGTRSAIADRVVGGKYIEIKPNREQLARYGIPLKNFQQVIQSALGGMQLSQAIEGRERYPIMVRYDRPYREDLNSLEQILITAPSGAQLTLADLASVSITEGPAMIKSENARLNGWLFVDTADQDLGRYVEKLQETLTEVRLPTGYSLEISGQFEQMQQANERLKMAIPATLLIVILLLYLHFNRWDRTWLIMLSVPFSLVGSIWLLWFANYNLSVAVAVGFIALVGIAVETAIVMLLYIDHEMQHNWPKTFEQLVQNVNQGALQRLRPKLMTVSTVILGLIPIFLTDGPGADVMRRIALPMIGGMVSTLMLTLILIPVIYTIMLQVQLKLPKQSQQQGQAHES